MIKIYENTIGEDCQSHRNQRMMVTGYILNAMTMESLGLPWWLSSKECALMQESQEMQVRSLDAEDPLQKDMATHSVFLSGESHGQRSLVDYSPERVAKSWT